MSAARLRIAVLVCASALGCGAAGAPSFGNLGFEIACGMPVAAGVDGGRGQQPCEWTVLEGTLRYGGTWNEADLGLDLTGEGRVIVEQRTRFEPPESRDYVLDATVLRQGPAVAFELHWYRALPDSVLDYWSASPALLRVDRLDVTATGLTRFRGLLSIPAEAGGVALRVVREGSGRAWVDELALGPVRGARTTSP